MIYLFIPPQLNYYVTFAVRKHNTIYDSTGGNKARLHMALNYILWILY
jgi:hypothetical protein